MTWPWGIFFSLLVLWPAAAASVTGNVRLLDSMMPDVRKGRDFSGVVVWLEPLHPVDPPATSVRQQLARMEQKDKQFLPHMLAIQAGTAVSFPNLDPIFHSAFSNFSGQIFDLALYAPGTSRTVTFDKEGVVRVFCNIHSTMSAVIVVLKYPWFSVTDAAGRFQIANVPPGEYQLHIFDERATEKTVKALERRTTVSDQNLALPPLTISEAGYLAEPHQNKYGQDYPPVSHAHPGYPADQK